jgi:hypothetical protein
LSERRQLASFLADARRLWPLPHTEASPLTVRKNTLRAVSSSRETSTPGGATVSRPGSCPMSVPAAAAAAAGAATFCEVPGSEPEAAGAEWASGGLLAQAETDTKDAEPARYATTIKIFTGRIPGQV